MKHTQAELDACQLELENHKVHECEVFSRVVGYYRPVQGWNLGKKDEFKHRALFDKSIEK